MSSFLHVSQAIKSLAPTQRPVNDFTTKFVAFSLASPYCYIVTEPACILYTTQPSLMLFLIHGPNDLTYDLIFSYYRPYKRVTFESVGLFGPAGWNTQKAKVY